MLILSWNMSQHETVVMLYNTMCRSVSLYTHDCHFICNVSAYNTLWSKKTLFLILIRARMTLNYHPTLFPGTRRTFDTTHVVGDLTFTTH